MRFRFYAGLFLAGLLIAILTASLETVPGYMDADYYYAGALRLVAGQGAQEPYIWNYLNDPAALPAPAFAYWMPLVSLLGAAGLAMARPLGFLGARLGFLLLAACIAPLTALLAYRLTGRKLHTILAGLLALFPGFYLAYLPTTDAFAISMVLGALFLLASSPERGWPAAWPASTRLVFLGVLAGLLHMTRADGLLWLVGGLWMAWIMRHASSVTAVPSVSSNPLRRFLLLGAALAGGYALVTCAWYIRNLSVWGSLFPPGGSRAMWITRYEETMIFPAGLLTPQHWLAAGWGSHLQAWWSAASNHLQTAVAVQGGIVLLPFLLIGMWKLRRCPEVRLGAGMWLLIAAVMTFIFPFAGINGGFFHSGAALQPLFWSLAPPGIETAMQWYARKRRLSSPFTMVMFLSILLLGTGVLLSSLLYTQRVVGSSPSGFVWSASNRHYQEVEQVLREYGAQTGQAVLVNNPPGYWLASERPAVVIPDGDEQMLLAAARKFHIHYLVLETNNPPQLADLYYAQVNPPELEYLDAVGTTRLYQIHLPGEE